MIISSMDPLQAKYRISDQASDGSISYYGYLAADGTWYILRETSAGEYRYCTGLSGYQAAWVIRHGLPYGYVNEVQW